MYTGISYNRDINAGINILNLGWYHHILGEPLLIEFQRQAAQSLLPPPPLQHQQ